MSSTPQTPLLLQYKLKIQNFIGKITTKFHRTNTITADQITVIGNPVGGKQLDNFTNYGYLLVIYGGPCHIQTTLTLPHSINYVIINANMQSYYLNQTSVSVLINDIPVATNVIIKQGDINDVRKVLPVQLYAGPMPLNNIIKIDVYSNPNQGSFIIKDMTVEYL